MHKKENTMIDYCKLGGRIASLRKDHHLTQEQLAEKLDISVKHCSEVERGLSSLSLEKLDHVAELFDCNLDYIIHGNPSPDCSMFIPHSIMEIMISNDEHEKALLSEYMQMYGKLRNNGKLD